jgi:hypothetical protein
MLFLSTQIPVHRPAIDQAWEWSGAPGRMIPTNL